jgi:hypothetical protein
MEARASRASQDIVPYELIHHISRKSVCWDKKLDFLSNFLENAMDARGKSVYSVKHWIVVECVWFLGEKLSSGNNTSPGGKGSLKKK